MSVHNLMPIYHSLNEMDVNHVLEILNKKGIECCKGENITENPDDKNSFTVEYEVDIHSEEKRRAVKILRERQKYDPSIHFDVSELTAASIIPYRAKFYSFFSIVFGFLHFWGIGSLLAICFGIKAMTGSKYKIAAAIGLILGVLGLLLLIIRGVSSNHFL